MTEVLRRRARELGFDDCRFTSADPPASAPHFQDWLAQGCQGEMAYLAKNAHKRLDPRLVLPGARSVISLAASYAGADSAVAPASGRVARYARFADYHDVLGEHLKVLAQFADRLGGECARSLWYVDTGPILERDLAQRAGLGFIGKHASLVSRKLGNWFFIAEILTTLELRPDPPETNHCGSCQRCLTACPTGALVAPFRLDARLCISYLTIELKGAIPIPLRPAIGNRIFGCDDCLAACPWNRFGHDGRLMKTTTRTDLSTPSLIELLGLSETEFKARFAGTPMARAKRRGLLRNVCVALGNTADSTALPSLEKAAVDPEPLIAEHARWAMSEIQRRATESNPPGTHGERTCSHPPNSET